MEWSSITCTIVQSQLKIKKEATQILIIWVVFLYEKIW
mgnify:CR=1 FL=1